MTNATYTYDDDCYSDLYKEAYGIRPRMTGWNNMSPDEKQETWDRLLVASAQSACDERGEEWKAMIRFEARVESIIKAGADDRETAIRWIAEAEEVDGDMDYLCFCCGIPYGYFGGPRNMMTGY